MNYTHKRKNTKLLSLIACLAIIASLGVMAIIGLQVRTCPTAAYASTPPANPQSFFVGNTGVPPTNNWYDSVARVSNAPMITVLTHGAGGGARDWSNNTAFRFAFDSASLIENLRRSSPNGANVYWARMDNDTVSFHLMYLPML